MKYVPSFTVKRPEDKAIELNLSNISSLMYETYGKTLVWGDYLYFTDFYLNAVIHTYCNIFIFTVTCVCSTITAD